MQKKWLIGTALLLLCGCDGPLSMVSYVLASGVAMHAEQEEFQNNENENYRDKCLPTHRRENPMVSAGRLEIAGNTIQAYEYYTIGGTLGYKDSSLALSRLKTIMQPKDVEQAEKNLVKYTEVHIKTCFIPAGSSGAMPKQAVKNSPSH